MIQTETIPKIYRPIGYDMGAWDLILRPQKHNRVPQWLGRAAQALFYSELHRIHPDIASYIHDVSQLKPFTVSNIIGAQLDDDMLSLSPDHPIKLRITTLHPHMTAIVQNGMIPALCKYGLSLHDQPMRIMTVSHKQSASHQTNAEDLLASAQDIRQITLKFLSPTSFKQTGGFQVAQPYPELVFGSLYQKWKSFCSYPLPIALEESIVQQIVIESSTIQSHEIRFARGQKGTVPCFLGTVSYRINEPESYLRRCIHALVQFAQFSSVGVQTTVGLGQVRGIS